MTQQNTLTIEEQAVENLFYEGYISGKSIPKPYSIYSKLEIPTTEKEIFLSLAKKKKISPAQLFSEMLLRYQS